MFKNILCPVDGSDASLQALDVAARLAVEQTATLTICTVADSAKAAAIAFGDAPTSAACLDAFEVEAKECIEHAAARVKDRISPRALTIVGQPTDCILDVCAVNACDLIVIGSHGRSGISRAFIGSVAEGVARHATVPVMIVRWTKSAVLTGEGHEKAAASA